MITAYGRPTVDHIIDSNNPAWLRAWAWAYTYADRDTGHAIASAGQLRNILRLSAPSLSRAIDQARDRGLLDQASSARCLVLPGQALAPCSAIHRGGV